jgi:hypothetical protein
MWAIQKIQQQIKKYLLLKARAAFSIKNGSRSCVDITARPASWIREFIKIKKIKTKSPFVGLFLGGYLAL